MNCTCGAPAFAIVVGINPIYEQILATRFVISAGRDDAIYCEACADKAGWPWLESERAKRKGKK